MGRKGTAAMWTAIRGWPVWGRVLAFVAIIAAWVIGGFIAYEVGWLAEACFHYPANPVLDSPAQTICQHRPNPKLMGWGLAPPLLVFGVISLIARITR